MTTENPPKIRTVLGYVTEAEAKLLGFTHHGRYFFVPVYMGALDSGVLDELEKFLPMGWLIDVCTVIEQTLQEAFWPEDEPSTS